MTQVALDRADAPQESAFAELERQLEDYRTELTGYAYRMLGSTFDAEDAVQETLVRAWKSLERFEGRAALRSWLYRIATNVCLDMLNGRKRRARPMDMGPASVAEATLGPALEEGLWVEPIPDSVAVPTGGDPAEVAVARESIRLAFVSALQRLPPKQRAVLILREVLRWQATEVAELLDSTVASVNSALQRARATLSECDIDELDATGVDPEQQAILEQYVDAFERYDVSALVALLRDDVQFSMPPHNMWLEGPDQVGKWLNGHGFGCKGSRLVGTAANGCAAFASYRLTRPGLHEPFALQIIEFSGGRISGIHNFLDTALFAQFGLPPRLEG
jgi:RNA polymerase sigma-70 factor, ECF subfamily